MEKRKLQRTGGASLTVTLPKKWIDDQQLQYGQQVAMHSQGSGTLLLKPVSERGQSSQTILQMKNLTPDMIMRKAIALFISGVNEITFLFPGLTKAQRSHIRSIIDRLIGFEIVEESSGTVVIRNILDITKLPIPDMVDKMFLLARSMIADAIEAALQKDIDSAQDIISRDRDIDKLYLVINRQFHSILEDRITEEDVGIDRLGISYYHTVALQLERIADHAVKIATAVTQDDSMKPTTAKALTVSTKQILQILDDAQNIIHAVSHKLAHILLDQNDHVEDNLIRMRQKHQQYSMLGITMLDSLDRTRGYLMNIAEATINYSTYTAEKDMGTTLKIHLV
ncbi:MAG: hypothetical protein A3C02_02890 [Candidatus Andersenbacteria bacterium RIFCSPHIGHO2_02_FULL_45_11]|uniref:SpoVT-AbrB domain-containing protein n=1 Tax=Candidatus Andersenbacteria bacterium RIFCSPHIGHO2_12_FULL_45_11 TaxID=1797281 RepID=A0A1G1X2Z9_9BACT|nr:MAG: hypothetical protein A2805_02915 [Candidatus Andersenbacteria bacterium RIFCSPHIGHO2_01_FULL_46_36]OGY32126.1 MAG: hypothetical protein A3C02_02890 [Candidatus Andersenbacteria bacterium RIFCSPHIGHO2_02_FULL_45_11]OGY34324.1 MAG: hypothetical protein A3D99_04650 [Candidatus Andersenbacteria bacterium RIFCSPHIGHO2_12_FULL_45_11]